MRKKYQPEQEEINRQFNHIEPGELDRLRAAMEKKKQVRINGRLQSRFRQVMYEWGVLRFPKETHKYEALMDLGSPVVVKPHEYTRWLRAESMINASDEKQQESYFEAFPEQRVEYEERMEKVRDSISAFMGRVKVEHE